MGRKMTMEASMIKSWDLLDSHMMHLLFRAHMILLRRERRKKKKKKKPVEYEDPSLREHLLAGAYGGVAKKKVKRQGVKYTTDLNAGLRDIATPASAFMRDPSKKNMLTSFSGF